MTEVAQDTLQAVYDAVTHVGTHLPAIAGVLEQGADSGSGPAMSYAVACAGVCLEAMTEALERAELLLGPMVRAA